MSKIQVLGLREYVRKDGKIGKAEKFYEHQWRFEHLRDVFDVDKLTALLSNIPEDFKYNLYFTMANCLESKGRQLLEQHALPFDVDHVTVPEGDTTASVVLAFTETVRRFYDADYAGGGLAALWSGHGVQLFYFLDYPIQDESFFDKYRESYKDFCNLFQDRLKARGIGGIVDTSVFSPARLMRLPKTINRKKDQPDVWSEYIQLPSEQNNKNFLVPKEEDTSQYLPKASIATLQVDTEGVQKECEFLQHCKVNQGAIKEPEWYAMLGIVSWLEDGRQLAHSYSSEHPGYSEHETEMKVNQALRMTGPRTCKSIDGLWGKCKSCKHFGNIKTPLQIMGENFIKTEKTGFRRLITTKDGDVKPGPIEYGDLLKAFIKEFNYKAQVVSDAPNGILFWSYREDHWKRLNRGDVASWTEKKLSGDVAAREVNEFIQKLSRNQVIGPDFFEKSSLLYKQFTNCVLDLRTGEMIAPAPELGITTVIPHYYDKHKDCPRWDKFLHDVCLGDQNKINLLNEFVGYTLFSSNNWVQKALILVGSGANGKSVFMDVLKELVGVQNYTSIQIEKLEQEYSVAALENKLLNVCGEVSHNALKNTANFKDMVAGSDMYGRNPYEAPRIVKVRAKFVLACNEVPPIYDQSTGFGRRPIIIEFNATFGPGQPGHDPHITQKLLEEVPGIINKALVSYENLKARGMFFESEAMLAEKESFLNKANAVADFVATYIERSSDASDRILARDLLDKAKEYAALENINDKIFTGKKLSAELKKRFKISDSVQCKMGNKNLRAYEGIKFKDEFMEDSGI